MRWGWARAAVLLLGLSGAACHPLTLDPFFYDPLPAPAGGYQLSYAIIPQSAVTPLIVHTSDGQTLNGAFIASSGRRPDLTILYFHGQSNNLGTTWPRLEDLYPLGYNIAMVDPRGYGLSTGTPTEAGLQIDEHATWDAVTRMVGTAGLVIYGRSLGTGMAIDLASTNPPAVLITESAFTSIAAFVGDATYVDLPKSFVSDSTWDNLAKVPSIPSPYLLFHGTADDYVDPKYSEQLAAAHAAITTNGTTKLILVTGATHDDVPDVLGLDTYRTDIQGFVEPPAPTP